MCHSNRRKASGGAAKGQISRWEEMEIQEHLAFYTDQGMDRKEAMKAVARDRGITKAGCVPAASVMGTQTIWDENDLERYAKRERTCGVYAF